MLLSNIEIILVEPLYSGNVGAIARSAHNYGIQSVKIVGDLDVNNLEAKKMALYGYHLLENTQRFNTLEAAVSDCNLVIGTVHQERFHRKPPLPIWVVVEKNLSVLHHEKVAVVFGREDNGLNREEINLCHELAVIPTAEGLSFNLAHAVTVVLYEMHKNRLNAHYIPQNPKRPTQSDYEHFFELLNSTLHSVGFFRGNIEESVMISLREIVYRSGWSASDLPIINAVLYKIKKAGQVSTAAAVKNK